MPAVKRKAESPPDHGHDLVTHCYDRAMYLYNLFMRSSFHCTARKVQSLWDKKYRHILRQIYDNHENALKNERFHHEIEQIEFKKKERYCTKMTNDLIKFQRVLTYWKNVFVSESGGGSINSEITDELIARTCEELCEALEPFRMMMIYFQFAYLDKQQ